MRFRLTPARRIALGVHASVFMAAVGQNEIVPLLPHIGHRYGLSAASIALLLAAPGIAMLALCVPIGALSDRLGARRLTLAGGLILCVAAFGQAVPSYGALVTVAPSRADPAESVARASHTSPEVKRIPNAAPKSRREAISAP